MSPITQARIEKFKQNRLGYFCFILFIILFILSLAAELIANERPLLVKYEQHYYLPVLKTYPETTFGGVFETEADYRKSAVKLAMGFQIAYLDSSGIMTADDKQTTSSVSIGRTKIDYGSQHRISAGQQFNLCLDAENALKQAGFSLIVGVDYDR